MTRFAIFVASFVLAGAQTTTQYRSITAEERWTEYKNDAFLNPGVYFSSLGAGLGAQLSHKPGVWKLGASGYAQRTGYYYTTNLIDNSIYHVSAAALGTDTRYDPSGKKALMARIGHALSRGFVIRNRDGKLTVNASNFMSSYGSGMIASYMISSPSYEPLTFGVRQGHVRFAANSGGFLLKEFAPEIKKIFRRR